MMFSCSNMYGERVDKDFAQTPSHNVVSAAQYGFAEGQKFIL